MILINQSMDVRFTEQMQYLKKKYKSEMFNLEGIGDEDLDINAYSQKFFGDKNTVADKTVDANSNVEDTSVVTWERESSKPILKLNALYILWKRSLDAYGIKRANKLVEAELNGTLRIHDLHKLLNAYCYATQLHRLITDGMPFYKKIKIGPVKHFDSFINLSLQYICYMSNHIAGAVAVPTLLVDASYFVKKDFGEEWFKDEKTVQHVSQQLQSFIYSVNFNWRSNQSPFTNVSIFDRNWLNSLFSSYCNADFSKVDFENVMRLQKLFVKVMLDNLKDNPFTFPVMTAAMLYDTGKKDFEDQEFFKWVSEVSASTGLFNFYIDSETASLSSCCRLRSNIKEASREYTNSFGVGGLDVGSTRVVTLNLPQIAYMAEDWEDFMNILEYRVEIAHDILDVHRKLLLELIADGRQPLYQYGFMNIDRQFNTVGFIGLYEALELMGFDIMDTRESDKAMEILKTINTLNDKRGQKTGYMYNLEQTPGESAAITFARKDKIQFSNAKYDLYSNQYIPLTHDVSLNERILAQGRYDRSVGGGSILHINVDEELKPSQVEKLIRFSAESGVVYFAINLSICKCLSCGKTFTGRYDKSPCHQADVQRFLRIVGYLTPIDSWSEARRQEYSHRQFYGSDVF